MYKNLCMCKNFFCVIRLKKTTYTLYSGGVCVVIYYEYGPLVDVMNVCL